MSLPPLNPEKTASGISVDPRTLDRVVASTRRADGSVRKELKIRPGFTPQEDVGRFRGSRQQASDKNTLPKGHIVGWVAPSSETKPKPKPGSLSAAAAAAAADTAEMTKAQKKNAKRAEKRAEKRTQPVAVKENWDDDDEDEEIGQGKPAGAGADNASDSKAEPTDVDAVTKEIGELKV
ncbi:unnamed protein product [Rhizoctonia solani]|uniref:WIBG Mago-binding domain-containing protein n=1 Tax=Rhizoctonia solani TaxID=456999 RepID=A0A8H3HE08_9AGAM|nr:unnamed protein product [Rhizoctonia solani]CAE6529157.1 unnamed protein product [Rhizoctonia solani]